MFHGLQPASPSGVAVRYPVGLGADTRPLAQPEAPGGWANVLNVSARGLRLLVCHPFAAGDLLEVALYG